MEHKAQNTIDAIDWTLPRRQSPAAIFVILLRMTPKILRFYWPLILVYLIPREPREEATADGSEGIPGFEYLTIVMLILPIVLSILRYWFYKFSIQEEHLEIQMGALRKKQVSIPLKNIQAVHLEQGIWHRLLQVFRISFDSTGSESIEVRLDALPIAHAWRLKALLSKESTQSTTLLETPRITTPRFRLDIIDLFKLSLTANHFRTFLLIAALGMQLFDDVEPFLRSEQKQALKEYTQSGQQHTIELLLYTLIFLAVLSILVSAGRTYVKYYNFELKEEPTGWRLNFGLFTRHQRFTPIHKIQLVRFEANWLRRNIDFWLTTLNTIGESAQKTGVKLQVPTTSITKAETIASEYLDLSLFEHVQKKGISSVYWQSIALRMLIFGSILGIITGIYWSFWASLAIGVFAVIIIGQAYFWQNNFRWAFHEQGLWKKSGFWGKRFELLRWEKLQQVELQQSLLQQRRNLATIKLVTAGGTVSLPFLPYSTALKVMDYSLFKLESGKEGWM